MSLNRNGPFSKISTWIRASGTGGLRISATSRGPAMPMKSLLKTTVLTIDDACLRGYIALFPDRSAIRGLVFHTVFQNPEELGRAEILPQQRLQIEDYRRIFIYFLEHGYTFISYKDLQTGLNPEKNYIYLTLDDGYFNNMQLLPILEEFNIPVHIFITTKNIEENKKFWWDIVYENRTRQGWSLRRIKGELEKLNTGTAAAVDEFICSEFGSDAYVPKSDLDRPLSLEELKVLSQHELVTVGNHTHEHLIATRITKEQFRKEILRAEKILQAFHIEIKGFAFPNGQYFQNHFSVLEECGVQQGFSTEERLFYSGEQFSPETRYRLGRFSLSASFNLEYQCRVVRAGGSPLRRLMRSWIARRFANLII
tara:strand:+ start:57 stop:1160 length:1104 start_codon:yes stop_codon:yes gene_type:complete